MAIGLRAGRARKGLPIHVDDSLTAFCRRQRARIRNRLNQAERRIQLARVRASCEGDAFRFVEMRGPRQSNAPGNRAYQE